MVEWFKSIVLCRAHACHENRRDESSSMKTRDGVMFHKGVILSAAGLKAYLWRELERLAGTLKKSSMLPQANMHRSYQW